MLNDYTSNNSDDHCNPASNRPHKKPCLYQQNPKPDWGTPERPPQNKRVHTESIPGRYHWGKKEYSILCRNHRYKSPQFAAVVKFDEVQTVKENQKYHERLSRIARDWKRNDKIEDFAVYMTREIDPANKFHEHLLVRTTVENPTAILENMVERASRKTARLAYCMPIDDLNRVTRYTVKYLNSVLSGQKKVLLFKKGIRLNLSTFFGEYFVKPKGELWAECIHEWFPNSKSDK